MKKIALLMALLMLLLSLAACGGQTNVPANTAGSGADAGTETGEATGGTTIACEHQYRQEMVSEPGCEEAGLMLYTCVDCEMSHTEEIPAYGHDGSGASCTEASTCARCGEVVENAWGHEDEGGVCATCGINLENQEIPGGSEATQPTEATEATETAE